MEILNKIIVLYKEIKGIYNQLYKLEKYDEKDSNLNLLLIYLLKKKIKEEELLIRELFDYFNDDIYDVYNLINDNDMKKRLIDSINLYECINGDRKLSKVEMLEQMKVDRLYIECYRNMDLIYYSFLQEYIDLDMYVDIKDSLLKMKYDNSFGNHDMESQLISNDFNVPKINYVILNLVIDTLRIDNHEMMFDCFAERILTSIYDILNIKDNDYDDDKSVVISVDNQCILRAGLVMINDFEYEQLVGDINNIISSNNSSNVISVGIVNSIIAMRNKDKERVKKLSLKPLCE